MLTDKQRRLITVALRAAERHGFALGGNAALTAHGLPGFSAKKIDLVTPREAVRDAAKAVEAELRREGYQPERSDTTAERRRVMFPPGHGMLAQWSVPTGGRHGHPPRGGITDYKCEQCYERLYLEISRAPRGREAVQTGLGPVLHAEDAAGTRVRELAARGQVRDYADTARLLERWSPRQLTGFARRVDPSLDPRDLDRAAANGAAMADIRFTWGSFVRPEEVPQVRERLANWQRDPRDTPRREPARQRERPNPAVKPATTPPRRGLPGSGGSARQIEANPSGSSRRRRSSREQNPDGRLFPRPPGGARQNTANRKENDDHPPGEEFTGHDRSG